jgi:hypothetical protein
MSYLHGNIKHLLSMARISVGRLANISDMQQPTLFRILAHPDREPRMRTVKPIADLLGVSVSDLMAVDLAQHIEKVIADNPFSWGLKRDGSSSRPIVVSPTQHAPMHTSAPAYTPTHTLIDIYEEHIKTLTERVKKLEQYNEKLIDAILKHQGLKEDL